MRFSNIVNVTGGSALDTVMMLNGGVITGRLDPGAGENRFSYPLRSTATTVNLLIPSATDIASLVDNFVLLIGGNGNDTLTGSNARGMVIVGGPGDDTITSGSLNDHVRIEYAQKLLAGDFQDPIYSGMIREVLFGDPGTVCADRAASLKAELIVIPSHGRSGVSRLLLGSVTERIVRLATCPVLVLKLNT